MAFVFYDTETTGTSTSFDQILQFAAVLTDIDFKEIDRVEMRCRLHPHVVPNAGALNVTGVSVSQMMDPDLPCHYEMIGQIQEKLEDWSPAVFIGYNSVRFDEELLRKALFKTLRRPYLTNTNGNSRADALTLVQMASVFLPDCLQIPVNENGRKVFKLDQLAPLNGFNHENAHDALADVYATIHLAKCVKDHAPGMWDRFLHLSSKAAVLQFANEHDALLLTEFYFNQPYQYAVCPIGSPASNPSALYCFDLANDVEEIADMDDESLQHWVATKPKKVRKLRANANPFLLSYDEASPEMLAPLTAHEIKERADRLKGDTALMERLLAAAEATTPEYPEPSYVEEMIYSRGFVSNEDQQRMNAFHAASWVERASMIDAFEDDRLRYHAHWLLFEERPELLADDVRSQMETFMWDRLLAEQGPKGCWTSLPQAIADTETLLSKHEGVNKEVVSGLHDYLTARLKEGQSAAASS